MKLLNPSRFLLIACFLAAAFNVQAGSYGEKATAENPSIVDIAAGNDDFSTLVAALTAADLVTVLQGDGPFTVFAPTNAAFAALPEGTVATLLLPENKAKLITVLTYHVVPGAVYAADVSELDSATTVQGGDISISDAMGTVKINNATVVTADIKASNGVIHVIDAVIMPQTDDVAAR